MSIMKVIKAELSNQADLLCQNINMTLFITTASLSSLNLTSFIIITLLSILNLATKLIFNFFTQLTLLSKSTLQDSIVFNIIAVSTEMITSL